MDLSQISISFPKQIPRTLSIHAKVRRSERALAKSELVTRRPPTVRSSSVTWDDRSRLLKSGSRRATSCRNLTLARIPPQSKEWLDSARGGGPCPSRPNSGWIGRSNAQSKQASVAMPRWRTITRSCSHRLPFRLATVIPDPCRLGQAEHKSNDLHIRTRAFYGWYQ